MWRLNGIARCQPGRPPELRASGSYPYALAAITSCFQHSPLTACTAYADSIVTDRGDLDRRDENLHRAVDETEQPAGLYGWLRAMPSSRTLLCVATRPLMTANRWHALLAFALRSASSRA
jgi:hypothetical protein